MTTCHVTRQSGRTEAKTGKRTRAAPDKAGRLQDGRFAPGSSGNPSGRPQGARHKATLAAEALLDGEAEAITRRCVGLALEGDLVALRLCLERLLPPRRERPVRFALPEMRSAADAVEATAALARAVADGDLTPGEAAELSRLLEAYTKTLEARGFEARLSALESRITGGT